MGDAVTGKRKENFTMTLVREQHQDEKAFKGQAKIVYDEIVKAYGINTPFSRAEIIELCEVRGPEFNTRQTVERVVDYYLHQFAKDPLNILVIQKAPKAEKPAKTKKEPKVKTEAKVEAGAPENKGSKGKVSKQAVDAAA